MSKKLCFLFSVFMMMSSVAHGQNLNTTAAPSFKEKSQGAPSESPADESFSSQISKITFSGLKRTKDSFLQESLKSYIGRPFNEKLQNELESDLQTMNLFSTIEINPSIQSDGSTELFINVKEKISFIPLPFAMYSSSTGFKAGAFLMDMNTFGKKDMTIAGLMWSPKTIMSVGMFKHAPKIGAPGFMVAGNLSKATSIICDSNGDDVLEFDNFNAGISTSILFKLDRYNSLDAGVGYGGMFLNGDYDFCDDLYDRNKGRIFTSWKIEDNNWNGVFLSSTSFSADAAASFDNKARLVSQLTVAGKIQQPLIPKLRLNIDTGAGIVLNGLVTDGLSRGTGRVTILDDEFTTEKIAGLSSGLEFALLQLRKIGTFSIYGNYEAVFAQEIDDSLVFCQGFNVGSKVYLSGLAFPAMSIGLAYNATKNKFYFSGSFGMSF